MLRYVSVLAVLSAVGLAAQAPSSVVRFADITRTSGLQFTHVSGGSGRYYYIEQWGSGAAFLDYDRDGLLDVFLTQGGALPGFRGTLPPGNRLFRNKGNGVFADVTDGAGLASPRYTLGVAAGDIDNDGYTDLFITALQGNVLYRNGGNGRFTDVSARAGITGKALSTGAAFLDYDNDGRLDLFVARYLDYNVATDTGCEIPDFGMMRKPGEAPRKTFCGPSVDGVSNRLYHNDGNGAFSDVTAKSGIGKSIARGLGVAVADYNDDGRADVFVASDRMPNLLFMNDGNSTFKEQGMLAGVGVGPDGQAFAGMGVDAADYDNDGRIDLVITNYENEPTSLYRNRGDGTFADESRRSGLSPLVWGFMKWGARLLDFNGDGLKDLFVVNGHIYADVTLTTPMGAPLPGAKRKGYKQQPQILVQRSGGSFADGSAGAGPVFKETFVSRGAAFGDIDNDGDHDALILNIDAPAVLLRNDSPQTRWARLELEGKGCNRGAIGARVRATAAGVTQTAIIQSGGSYLSDHDRRPVFALGGRAEASAEIRWPCGALQRVSLVPGKSQRVVETGCKLPPVRSAVHPH